MANSLIEAVEIAQRNSYDPKYAQLVLAAEKEDTPTVQQLMNCRTEDEHTRNSVRGEALVLSAMNGYTNIVKLLLQFKVNVEHADDGGFPPLGWAAFGGHVEIVELLLKAGARINTKGQRKQDNTPLISAVHNSQHTTVQALLDWRADTLDRRADTEARDILGRTALHWAAELGYCDSARLLIDADADINAREFQGRTPLHLACEHGREEIVDILLHPERDRGDTKFTWGAEKDKDFVASLRGRANLDGRDADGRAAVHVAALYGHQHIVRMCLKCGADAEPTGPRKVSVLMYAVDGGNPDVVAEVISHGVNINAKDYKGRTALCWAVRRITKENRVKMQEIIKILEANSVAPQPVAYDRKKLHPVVQRIASRASNLILFLAIWTTIYTSCQRCLSRGEAPI